jgi:glycosyltransferase involved in cell wall biosynthesis
MSESMKGRAKQLRVCYFGTYRAGYTRNQILLAGLKAQENVAVQECHVQLWQGIEDRVEKASGGWRSPRFWRRVAVAYWKLLRAHGRLQPYDVMLIGYPGQFDSYLARLLTWRRRKPMALDILMSLHLVAEERGLTERSAISGRLIYWLEKIGLHLPDLLISENDAYEAYYCRQYGLDPGRFMQVPHGADDRVFRPRDVPRDEGVFRVTYHGGFLPSHGLGAVLGAARLLREQADIHFHFYGQGPEQQGLVQAAADEDLTNITFHGFVSLDELLNGIARADVALGVFGQTKQSHYTIQNKVWEGLAMARPVISGDSAVVRESLAHGEHIYLVKRDDPQALARGLIELRRDPQLRERLAQNGYSYYQAHNSVTALGARMEDVLRTLV